MTLKDDLAARPPLDVPAGGWMPLDAGEGMVGVQRDEPGRTFPRRVIAPDERTLAMIIGRIDGEQPQD